jgi:hypothetical protein
VTQLQDDERGRDRDGQGDDPDAVAARHAVDVLRDEEQVQERKAA